MEVEIKKTVEIVNDGKPKTSYDVSITRKYGTGGSHWEKKDFLFKFDEEDARVLAQKLSERFLAAPDK